METPKGWIDSNSFSKDQVGSLGVGLADRGIELDNRSVILLSQPPPLQ
jgi:hypothetical protein